jgi:nucleoside-diphosphate-sugar epimerase
MRVFVTGASGWIGSATVGELLADGHEVVGLARSDSSAAALERRGAVARRSDLDDLEGLRAAAAEADAVVHLANKHDWSDMAASNRAERGAVETMLGELEGSDRPFLLASGLAGLASGRLSTEADRSPHSGPDAPRGGTEALALEFADRGVRTVSLRFAPTVHGTGDQGFVALIAAVAREKGVSAWIGDGSSHWPAVHRSDAGRLVADALVAATPGLVLHVAAEEGVSTRAIAEALGESLGLPSTSVAPADAGAHFGWIGGFFGQDMPASSEATRRLLGWSPSGPTLLDDIAGGAYSAA